MRLGTSMRCHGVDNFKACLTDMPSVGPQVKEGGMFSAVWEWSQRA